MKKRVLTIGLLMVTLIGSLAIGSVVGAQPTTATEDEIEDAIDAGISWLTRGDVQDENGSWNNDTPRTCFALVKLQEWAYELAKKHPELGIESPFDEDYPYSENVIRGWEYIFGESGNVPKTNVDSLADQWHDGHPDNPDTNGNGYGIRFDGPQTYSTGICAMALAASGTPDRPNDGELDHDNDGNIDTFKEIAQDAVDWLAFAQVDSGAHEGGWNYEAQDNADGRADQSNSGYAVLGLAYGEDFGCTVPDWVRTELNKWINYIQCHDGSNDGGSGYDWPCSWVNELKTGNLIFEMCFVGDLDDPLNPSQRFLDALGYIERHWRDSNTDPGWGYNVAPADYQAMYCLMKGFEYCGVDLIDTDGDGERDDDWFNQEPPASPAQDFATVLVAQQEDEGYWPWCNWGDDILCTTWALLTLEKAAPERILPVYVDIKPSSCPNPFNTKSKGVLPVAVLGTESLDVTTVDPATIQLTREGYEASVSPLRWSYEDVATPFEGELCECHDLNGDGYLDLTLKFKTQEVKETLDLKDEAGNTIPLLLTGNLREEEDGTPIEGSDCVRVLRTGKK